MQPLHDDFPPDPDFPTVALEAAASCGLTDAELALVMGVPAEAPAAWRAARAPGMLGPFPPWNLEFPLKSLFRLGDLMALAVWLGYRHPGPDGREQAAAWWRTPDPTGQDPELRGLSPLQFVARDGAYAAGALADRWTPRTPYSWPFLPWRCPARKLPTGGA